MKTKAKSIVEYLSFVHVSHRQVLFPTIQARPSHVSCVLLSRYSGAATEPHP